MRARVVALSIVGLTLAVAAACGTEEAKAACARDSDCAEPKICRAGQCVISSGGPLVSASSKKAAPIEGVVSLAAGLDHACAVTRDGALYCWGGGESGQLGDGRKVSRSVARRVPISDAVTAVAAGFTYTCALTGSKRVFCWGADQYRQLAREADDAATLDDGPIPCSPTPAPVPGVSGVTAIHAGFSSTIVVLEDGRVFGWGSNAGGALGSDPATTCTAADGTRECVHTPRIVPLPADVRMVRHGSASTCGVRTDGSIVCIGSNEGGQLGTSPAGTCATPTGNVPCSRTSVTVQGAASPKDLSIVGAVAFAHFDDRVLSWGAGQFGQLGRDVSSTGCFRPTLGCTHVPGAVQGLDGVKVTQSFAGRHHSCVLDLAEHAHCWGRDDFGQTGFDATEKCTSTGESIACSSRPALVQGETPFATLALGATFTCGLTPSKQVWCWGDNGSGQLGDLTTTSRTKPAPVVIAPDDGADGGVDGGVDSADGGPSSDGGLTDGGTQDGGQATGTLARSLVGYWPFNGSGNDLSVHARHLTLYGNATYAAGKFGQGLALNGSVSTYAARPVRDTEYNFGPSDFSIQAWIKYNDPATEQVIVEYFVGQAGPSWSFTKLSTQGLHFYATGSGQMTSPALTWGTTWHHVVVMRTTNIYREFVDGVERATFSSGSPISSSATALLLVGKRNAADGRGFAMNGVVDELAIWTRTLTPLEIEQLYNNGAGSAIVP